jgi:uncharacterized repeat protein (TIGR03803 family)
MAPEPVESRPEPLHANLLVCHASSAGSPVLALLLLLGVLAGASTGQAQDRAPFEHLHSFLGSPDDGEYLNDPVIEGRDGRLYGATINGGVLDGGVVFAMAKDGSDYVILHEFTETADDGMWSWGGVIQGYDGKIYGAARYGGTYDAGVVYSLTTNGTDFTVLYSFTTNANEGAYPLNTVIQASDGRLYGRTVSGGTNDGSSIFGINTDGKGYKLLHSFNPLPFWDDSFSGLIEGSDGMLYGTTYADGAYGDGSVFRLNKDGTGFQTLHDFKGSVSEGCCPFGTVYETREGVLYGTTSYGGPDDYGMLYKINRDGTGFTILRFFVSWNDAPGENLGYLPVGPPVEGPGGLLYGTTYFDEPNEAGVVYCIRKDGSGYTVLHRFDWDVAQGAEPNARLTWGSDGALYGTTFLGGTNSPSGGWIDGSVFRIEPVVLLGDREGGRFTVLFDGFASQRYALYASDSLPANWVNVATVTNRNGMAAWSEPSPSPSSRFYRAQILNP